MNKTDWNIVYHELRDHPNKNKLEVINSTAKKWTDWFELNDFVPITESNVISFEHWEYETLCSIQRRMAEKFNFWNTTQEPRMLGGKLLLMTGLLVKWMVVED